VFAICTLRNSTALLAGLWYVAVPSQADTRLSSIGATWSTNAFGGMFITLWIARLPLSHRRTVLRSPVNGSEAPMWKGFTQRDVMRATGTQRVSLVASTSSHAFSLHWPSCRLCFLENERRTLPHGLLIRNARTPNKLPCACALVLCIMALSWGARSDWNHTYAAYCYHTNTSFNNPACNCFGEPMPDAMRTTRHTIRILVSSWPAAAFDAFLLKIIIWSGSGQPSPAPISRTCQIREPISAD